MKKIHIFLLLIFSLALLLRIYDLHNVPSGFHRDEAFLGYNAYSLLKSGKDMNGVVLPFHLKSFLYTPAGYSYLSIIPILVFGLNEFSVRFSSAFFGALSVIPLYYIVRFALKQRKLSEHVALTTSFFLAITPWHIILSRTASVITVVTFFILCGVVFAFLWEEKKKGLFLLLSFVFFVVSLMFYISPYSFLPVFVPALFLYLGILKRERSTVFKVFALTFLCIIVPLVITLFSKELSLRVRSLSIANHDLVKLVTDEQIREDGVAGTQLETIRFFHNKPINLLHEFSWNYIKHVSLEFFLTDNYFPDRYRVPFTGLLYLWMIPLFLLGVVKTIKDRLKFGFFCFLWIVSSPLGSALTYDDVPNIQRILFMLPPILIVLSLGYAQLMEVFKNKYVLPLVFLGFSLISLVFFLHQYFIHARVYRPWYRQDGYKDLVKSVIENEKKFKKIVITNRESAPAIFFLFYTAYDPDLFFKDTKTPNTQDYDRVNFSNLEFSQEECPLRYDSEDKKITGQKNVLYVNSGLCKEFKDIQIVERIFRVDQSEVFRLVKL